MKMLSRVAVAAFLLCVPAAPGGAARGESGQAISRDSGRTAATDGAANGANTGVFAGPAGDDVVVNPAPTNAAREDVVVNPANSGVFARPADTDVVVNAAHEDDVRAE